MKHYIKEQNGSKTFEVGKMVCVGRNYAAHAAELGNEVPEFPLIFIKPASAMIPNGSKMRKPDWSDEMHHEVELVLVIGKTIKDADEKEAEEAIAGYTVGLDMTLRDWQMKLKEKGEPWTLAKCFDDSAMVADYISKEKHKLTLKEKITLEVNGTRRQDAELDLMLYKPVQIVSFLSKRMTLEEGDLVFTGTPAGVGKVVPGDVITGAIEGIASLKAEVI
ncbi:MAG: putative protein YcgM [Ignavibacteriaceae bacterium]|nr:putative protein YcgM [Ignavibacteriaceae bacterium]MCK6614117.1 fumarylacetoacetate hydrolase family protein [Ignavibacteriaceae bacterium]